MERACLEALKQGYRHIDTAHAYQNERSVGEAVWESRIPRDEIWVTSKLWPRSFCGGISRREPLFSRNQRIHSIYGKIWIFSALP